MTSRPLLLYILQRQKESGEDNTPYRIPDHIQAIAASCIQCARHSNAILSQSWIDGSFKSFDYFYTRYLFSILTILAISHLVGGSCESARDQEDFRLADELLKRLKTAGSLPAMEFDQHIEALKNDLRTSSAARQNPNDTSMERPRTDGNSGMTTEMPHAIAPCPMTTDMALSEPSLEAFLLQNLPSLDQTDEMDFSELEGLYWPVSDM